MLLYMAAGSIGRRDHSPALQAERTVISDRFLLANIAYQGYAGGLGIGGWAAWARSRPTGSARH